MSDMKHDPEKETRDNPQSHFAFEDKSDKKTQRRGPRRKKTDATDEPVENKQTEDLKESTPSSEVHEVAEDVPSRKPVKRGRRGRKPKAAEGGQGEPDQGEALFSSDRDDAMHDTSNEEIEHTIIPSHYENARGHEEDASDERSDRSSSEERTEDNPETEAQETKTQEGQSGGQQQQGHDRRHHHKKFGGRFNKNQRFQKHDQHRHKRFNKPGDRHEQGHGGRDHHQHQNKQWKTQGNSNEVGDNKLIIGDLPNWEMWYDDVALEEFVKKVTSENKEAIQFNKFYEMPLAELTDYAKNAGIDFEGQPNRAKIISAILKHAFLNNIPCIAKGVIEVLQNGHGLILYASDSYKHKPLSTFVHKNFIKKYGLKYGHIIEALVHPPREYETCPSALKIMSVMSQEPETIANLVPFNDLVPYYPTERIMLETKPGVTWDNVSMRVVDLLTPIGLGQRGLIVAPPRTGKTVLMHAMANAILMNKPNAHLIVLLVDERPEEVTDFKRHVNTEVISSTFDETAEGHVHAAEVVINKARRMVEAGKHVIILLDSITRLARAYNTLMPSSGKILSGGVEANALQWPKRFFGAARNIEGGGSLTILGTALIETGSRMDEVIFEEFKGTGNMELHLDRSLVDKRIFPAINLEKSGTRKEELLYHPDEMNKVYSLRRAMKGVPSTEAMEMFIQRIRKTKSNPEFLMGLQ